MDNKLFDATVDLKLRQFYILAYGGSIASILGFVTNIFIYGFTGPTFFYGFCTLVVTLLGVIGCSTRNYRRIAHILLCMFAFVEFPTLYYIYGGGTIVYMVASISAIAIFVTEKWSMLLAGVALVWDIVVVWIASVYPSHLEKISRMDAISTTICSLVIVAVSIYMMTMMMLHQQRNQEQELRRLNRQLKQEANLDPLTGLYNRRYMDSYLKRIEEENRHAHIAMLDLDLFKKVNDDYGHTFGDRVLLKFSRLLQEKIGEKGAAIRFGGEEFVLILPETTREQVEKLLTQLRREYMEFLKQEVGVTFTFSCGIHYCQTMEEYQGFYKCIDEKLYRAKKEGRDRFVFE